MSQSVVERMHPHELSTQSGSACSTRNRSAPLEFLDGKVMRFPIPVS